MQIIKETAVKSRHLPLYTLIQILYVLIKNKLVLKTFTVFKINSP